MRLAQAGGLSARSVDCLSAVQVLERVRLADRALQLVLTEMPVAEPRTALRTLLDTVVIGVGRITTCRALDLCHHPCLSRSDRTPLRCCGPRGIPLASHSLFFSTHPPLAAVMATQSALHFGAREPRLRPAPSALRARFERCAYTRVPAGSGRFGSKGGVRWQSSSSTWSAATHAGPAKLRARQNRRWPRAWRRLIPATHPKHCPEVSDVFAFASR